MRQHKFVSMHCIRLLLNQQKNQHG